MAYNEYVCISVSGWCVKFCVCTWFIWAYILCVDVFMLLLYNVSMYYIMPMIHMYFDCIMCTQTLYMLEYG